MVSYRYLGSALTNANGVATFDYQGTGAGEIDVIASLDKPITDGSIVSETYGVIDAIQKNDITTNSDEWYTGSAVRTVVDNGIKFEGSGYALFNKKGTPKNYHSQSADWERPLCFEIDVISVEGNVNFQFNVNNQVNTYNWTILSQCSIKLTAKDGTVKLFVDGQEIASKSYTETSDLARIGIQLVNSNSSVIVNNARIYPI